MKIVGRFLAILIAAVISVFAVQRFIRRMYDSGKRYITLSGGEGDPTENGD